MHARLRNLAILSVLLADCAGANPDAAGKSPPRTRERQETMEIVPDSPSEILKAAGILWVRVQNASFGEWGPASSPAVKVRKARLTLALNGVLKGKYPAKPGSVFTLEVNHYAPAGSRIIALPGLFGNLAPDTGSEFIAFSRVQEVEPAVALSEANCFKIVAASEGLEDVRLAAAIEDKSSNFEETLRLAEAEAPKLGFLFPTYLWAKCHKQCLENAKTYDKLVRFIEAPGLTYVTRYELLSYVSSGVMGDGLPSGYPDRLGLAMFRILALPGNREIKGDLISVYLPNLIGLQSGDQARKPADIFRNREAEKEAAREYLQTVRESEGAEALLEWLGS